MKSASRADAMRSSPRILVADSCPEARNALALHLEDANPEWVVRTADGGKAALALQAQFAEAGQPFDLLLTEFTLESNGDGLELMRNVQRLDPSVLAIVFTCRDHSLDRDAGIRQGAFDVIDKVKRGRVAANEINLQSRAALRYASRRSGWDS